MIKKIERKTLSEQVYKQMKQHIQSGEWKVGERIPNEKTLMDQFGISRNTLREAISSLANIGLVETRPGDGTFVIEDSELSAVLQPHLSRSSVLEILEVRHALDRKAAALASLRRTQSDLSTIHKFLTLSQKAAAKRDVEAFVQADLKLHQSIVDSAHNHLLSAIYTNLFQKIQASIVTTLEMSKEESNGHVDLVRAIENRDPDCAKKEVDHYIYAFKKLFLEKEESK